MKKYILAVLFCGTFTFCSCSGFLDEVPKGQITTESYYRTEHIIRKTTRTIFQNETVRFSSDCQNEMVRFELKFNSIETVFDYRFNAIKF